MEQVEQILRLQSLFRGNSRVLGQHSAETIKEESGKIVHKTRSFAKGPCTEDHWKNHLDGKVNLALVPINDYQEVKFMVIDVDLDVMEELKVTLHSICAQVEANGMPFIVCRSKSGAAHLYVFFKQDTKAAPVRNTLIRMADFMGMTALVKPVEFYPHTSKIDKESNGKCINLPYFNSRDSDRYAISATGNRLSLDEFISLAERKMVEAAEFCKWNTEVKNDESIRDVVVNGPPCLQTIYDQGIQDGTKNDILFQFAILFKKFNSKTFEDNVEIINQTRCDTPHDSSDLSATLKGLKKKSYHYNCAHPCMSNICAKSLCKSRKYGIRGAVEFPEITKLLQWGASDEYFEIVFASGAKIKIEACRLMDFTSVQGLMLQALHIAIPIPKKSDWFEFVTSLMLKVERIEVPKEFNVESSIRSLIVSYATSRTMGNKLEDLIVKKPVRQGEEILIRHKDLQEEILKKRFPQYIDGLEYSVVVNDLKGRINVIEIGGQPYPVFIIPDPKINQEELLEKIATDYQPQY